MIRMLLHAINIMCRSHVTQRFSESNPPDAGFKYMRRAHFYPFEMSHYTSPTFDSSPKGFDVLHVGFSEGMWYFSADCCRRGELQPKNGHSGEELKLPKCELAEC